MLTATRPASTDSPHSPPAVANTAWLTVLLAISAGLLAAFQIGKVHIALPSIRQSFALGLISASWILSALNVVGLFVATPAGTVCSKVGNTKSIVIGLLLIAVASAFGAGAPTLAWLLLSRFFEGVGFVAIVVAAPSLIVEVTRSSDLRLVLAGWSAYIPGGTALVTVLASLILTHYTWRAVWWCNAALLVAAALAVALLAKQVKPSQQLVSTSGLWTEFRSVATARGPLLLALIFGMYTMQHLSVMGFMPTLLHDRFHLSDGRIGVLVAIAMASNIFGNLAAGVLLQRGFSRSRIIIATSVFMALMTVGLFLLNLQLPWFYACAFAFSCIGGLIPSSVMGAAPFHAPSPTLIGATNGLLVQGSNLGICLGPPLMSSIAIRFGWHWVPAMTVIAAATAIVLAGNLHAPVHSREDIRTDTAVS